MKGASGKANQRIFVDVYLTFMKTLFSLVFSLVFLVAARAQNTNSTDPPSDSGQVRVIQLSGVVKSIDSIPLPYAVLQISGTKYGTSANLYGYFNMPVKEGDLIIISFVGFRPAGFRVPKNNPDNKLTITEYLQPDTQYLNEVVINPWPSSAEFNYVFVHKDIPDDNLERALKNLDPAVLQQLAEQVGRDGSENATAFFAQLADQNSRMGQQPYNPFFMTGPNGQIIPSVNFTKVYAYLKYLQQVKAAQKKR